MDGFHAKSRAALTRERQLEFRVRQLLITRCGVHDPRIVLIEEEPGRYCVLYTVQTLTGRAARTAFIEPGDTDGDPEIVVCAGFVF